jgi:hypothetical protein
VEGFWLNKLCVEKDRGHQLAIYRWVSTESKVWLTVGYMKLYVDTDLNCARQLFTWSCV